MPEDLPDSLKYAHLNPKVAAYLASKEKQKQEEDMFGDGMGKKSLMPEISQAFNAVKNRLDSSLSNDEDSQRYLFEEARQSAGNTLLHLSRIIYFYDNIATLIPKSLEYQMMSGFSELTSDVQVVTREWQTQAAKEAFLRRLNEAHSDDEQEKIAASIMEDGRSSRGGMSVVSESVKGGPIGGAGGGGNKKRLLSKAAAGLPEIVEDSEGVSELGKSNLKRSDSRQSLASRRSKGDRHYGKQADTRAPGSTTGKSPAPKRGFHDYDFMSALTETPSDNRSTAMANPSYYMSVIQFQLSSKVCEEKGWIIQKGKEEELAKEAVLEYCVQRLLQELKLIKEQKTHEAEMGFTTPPVVRYYGDARRETLLKYRKSPTRTSPNTSLREGKPRIPNMYDDHNEGRQLMMTTHIDGTTIAYYPSGRTAVVAAAAGFGRPGFYTIVYDDDPDMRMLATFTPSGRGVCYHMNGNVRFLSTLKGGHLANKNGRVIRQWKWPQAQVKLTTPVQFQMNQNLGFRCVAENYIVVVLTCQKESTRFFVSAAPGANEQQRTDETDQLLTAFTFSSKAAKDLLRLFAPKTKGKSKRKKEKMTKQLAEIVKSVDTQDKLMYDLECDRELARLQRKARNLVDDWLEHYRVTIGLKSPMLIQLSETPRMRPRSRGGAYSAKTTADGRENRRSTLGLTARESLIDTARVPSAPSRASVLKQSRQEMSDSESGSPNRLSSPAVKFDHHMAGGAEGHAEDGDDNRPFTSTFSDKLSRFSESSYRSKSASSRSKSAVSRQPTALSLPDKDHMLSTTALNITSSNNNINLCPIAIRMQMLGDSRPACRCSRHSIPYITDVEYHTYINVTAPKNQLQIVVVVSSLHPQTHSEMMLSQIYQNQNRNRTRPCLQSNSDMYRILKYDINTAGEGSDHTQPLLLTRHNVVPGMFLIYANGKLLFCDHIFNGYGNATRDFKKQVMKSRLDYIHGFSLPEDFRFSPSKGSHGPRAPWGGEIGGAGVDHYGSSGTLITRSLTDIGSSREDGLADIQTDTI
ncbi:glutamate-rich protein 6, partial [Plakobranchus ocellatus]